MYSLWIRICKHTSWSPPEMRRSIWKDEPIFPSIYSANPPAGVQFLCPIKLAVVALLYTAAQQSSKAKHPELWKARSSSTAPSRSRVCGAEAAIPLLLLRLCGFVFRLGICFLVFEIGKVGKGKYLWMRFFICNLFYVSVLSFWSLPSSCIQLLHPEQGSKLAPQQWPICLGVHGGEEGQSFLHKESIQNSWICFNMLQNILAFSLVTYKVPLQKISGIDLKLKKE